MLKRGLLIFFLVLAVGFAVHQSAVNLAIEYAFRQAAKNAGYELDYREVAAAPASFTLIKPTLKLPESKGILEAESLSLNYAFHPFSMTLDLSLNFVAPHVELQSGKATFNLESLITNINRSSSWLTINGHLQNQEGTILLKDLESPVTAHFTIDHCWGKENYAHYTIHCGDAGAPNDLEFSLTPDGGFLHAKQIDAAIITKLLQTLFPSLESWDFDQGTFQGDLSFRLDRWNLTQGSGELLIKGLSFSHKSSKIKAEIEEVLVKISPDDDLASLDFINGNVIFDEEEPFGTLNNLKGKLALNADHRLELISDCLWTASGQQSYAFLKASCDTHSFQEASLGLYLDHLSPSDGNSSIEVNIAGFDAADPTLRIACKNIREREFRFGENLVNHTQPHLNPISYISGTVSADINVNFKDQSLALLSAEKIDAKKLFLIIKPWELAVGSDNILGQLSIDFSHPNPHETFDAALEINNGQVAFTGINLALWNFTHIETNLLISKGLIQESSASVQLAGLKGSAKIQKGNSSEIVSFSLNGKGSDLLPFVPPRIQKGIEQELAGADIHLTAHVERILHGVTVLGQFIVGEKNAKPAPPIDFGFTIERILPLLRDTSDALGSKEHYFNRPLQDEAQLLIPAALGPAVSLQERHLAQEVGMSGFTLRHGWFEVHELPLGTFIGPFLFPEKEMKLSGVSDVEGQFDLRGVIFRYNGKGVVLENEKLAIEVPEILAEGTPLPAIHLLDLSTHKHYGTLPLLNGSYFDKNSGLLFTDMAANVVFEGEKVHIDNLEAYSNGLYFAGRADVDYSSPLKGYYNVDICSHTMEGAFSQAQHLFTHFEKPFFFTHIPLEGDLNFGPTGGRLTFAINPDDYDLQARFDCQLADAKLFCPNADLSVQELNLNFFYDHEQNILDIADLQGILLVGKPEQLEEYSIHSDKIHFSDYEGNKGEFDLWIKEGLRDFIRLAGSVQPLNSMEPETVQFLFDLNRSHFGEMHPQIMELTLKDWNRIEHLKLALGFRLSTLLHDLQKIGRAELSFLSRDLLNDLTGFNTFGGDFNLDLGFEGYDGKLGFNLAGRDVFFDQHHFKQVALTGFNQGSRWAIEQLQLDELSIGADLTKEEDVWKVSFLGARYATSFLIGLDGSYRYGDPKISAHVNLLEIDLSKSSEWGELKNLIESSGLSGQLKGTGQLSFEKVPQTGWVVDALLDTSFSNLKLQEFSFQDAEHISCNFRSDRGVTLRNIKSAIIENGIFAFELNQLRYEFGSQLFGIEGLQFSFPSERLPHVTFLIKKHFPTMLSPQVEDALLHLKPLGKVQGALNVTLLPYDFKTQLQLADDTYFIGGEPRQLKGFTLDVDQEEIKLTTLYQLNQLPVWVSLRSHTAEPSRGEIILADTLTEDSERPALIISWENDTTGGFKIQKMKGTLADLAFDLSENTKNPTTTSALHLTGSIHVIGSNAYKILPADIAKTFQSLQIGNGYKLSGDFEVAKEAASGEDRPIRIFGSLQGTEIELKGYRFQNLTSQILLEPNSFQLLDFNLSDSAGALHINSLKAQKHDIDWKLSIPLVTAFDFRPSLLRDSSKISPKSRKPLLVRQLFVQDITGYLNDTATLRGHGSLHFVNPQKKNLQNTIFAIPAEILTRIGLNLSVLTPVSGTIHFEVQSGKIFLTKFKDVFSDNKISKFYLPTSGAPSTIDFDGNLNIQVRFKQSTLLLKLAELFTVTVQGTLKKPRYSLQRQKYLLKQDVYTSSEETGESDNAEITLEP